MVKYDYVIELANDIISTNKGNPLMRDSVRDAIEGCVNNVLNMYKRGLISRFEAVYLMSSDYDFLG